MTMKGRAAVTITLITMLAACAPPHGSAVAAATDSPSCADHRARFADLIGQDARVVAAQLRGWPGIRIVRSGGPRTPMTMDFHRDRATILEVDGRVARITCG